MRIIAGKFGGRRLNHFKAEHIRPTTDRIKEVMFNKLQSEMDDARVLDLFSGTGNLGLEAVSRGAKVVHAVEKNHKSVQIIKDNCDLLKVGKDEMHIYKQDVFSFLKGEFPSGYDIIFIDPPFTEKIGHDVMVAMGESAVSQHPCKVFIETGRHEKLENLYGPLVLVEQKNYGDKHLSLFQSNPTL
jgi:16S rRNA (guanine966-N2)-methyltransferase